MYDGVMNNTAATAPKTTFNRWLDRFLAETDKFTLDPALHERLRWTPNAQGQAIRHNATLLDLRNASCAEFTAFFHSL